MPVWVIVLAVILAAVVFLLTRRLKFLVAFTGELEFSVKYLFLTFRINKPQQGQAKKKKREKAKPKPKLTLKDLREFLEIFERFWVDIKSTAGKIRRALRVDFIDLRLTVGSDDAAETAIYYGAACAAVYPVISAAEMLVKIKKKRVKIDAQFNGEVEIVFNCRASIRVSSLLIAGASSLVKIAVSLIKNPIHIGQRGVAK